MPQNEDLVQINKNFTSRSAVLCDKVCSYKRFLQYELDSSGYTTEFISLDLLIGTCVHRGLQHLLEHCRLEHPDGSFEPACIDEAVEKAYEIWRDALSKHQLGLKSSAEYDRLDWIIAEQEVLFEGLIRAFAYRRLPYLLEEYEILEVEHEEVYEDFSPIVTFLAKADGLFRRKVDNRLVILSIKTTSQYADVTTRDILHDMQGVSEWVCVQDRLEKLHSSMPDVLKVSKGEIINWQKKNNVSNGLLKYLNSFSLNAYNKPEIFAVQYEYLIKGQRKQDPYGSGIYRQQSFLCHPLKFDTPMTIMLGQGGGLITNPDEYKWKSPKGKLPKGWEKIDIWNDIGIKAWTEMLAKGDIQAEEGHPFDTILVTPDLVVRNEKEIEEWKISTAFREEQIVNYLQEINSYFAKDLAGINDEVELSERQEIIKQLIWQYFPKNTLSCHDFYGKDCVFVKHCHEQISTDELINCGYLIRRESHHKLEKQVLAPLLEGTE